MKRSLLYFVGAIIIIGVQFFVNCSNPLDDGGGFNPVPPGPANTDTIYNTDTVFVNDTTAYIDTIYIPDTVIVFDTSFITDTLYNVDTILVPDTIILVDTVIVIEPDPNAPQMICSRIASSQKEIVWMFRNPEGIYHLELVAAVESDDPSQKLYVYINDEKFSWKPVDDPELIMEIYLAPNTTIRIESAKPPAYGHAIDVCLTISTPK